MVPQGYEDLKRHRHDRIVNESETFVLDTKTAGEFRAVQWQDVQVGDIIKISSGQR